MLGKRLVLLIAVLFLAVPLTGCFGSEEPTPGTTTDNTSTNTTPGTNTTGGTPPGGTTPGGVTPGAPKPAAVNETVALKVATTPPATSASGTATSTGSASPGYVTCKVTVSTTTATFAPPQSVTIKVADSAGTEIASVAYSAGAPPSGNGARSADCTGQPTAVGPLTVSGTGTTPSADFSVLIEIAY